MKTQSKSRFFYYAAVLIAGIIIAQVMDGRVRASEPAQVDLNTSFDASESGQQLLDRFDNAELTSHRYGRGGRRYFGGGWLSSRYGNFGIGGSSYGSGYYSFGHLPYGNYGYHSPYSGLGYRPYGSFYRPWSYRYGVGRYAYYRPWNYGYRLGYSPYRYYPSSLTIGYGYSPIINYYGGLDYPRYRYYSAGATIGYHYVPVTTCCSHAPAYVRGDYGFCSAPSECECDD